MDRISALRNVEQSLAAFEAGEQSLAELEHEVRGVLRTYATSFETRSAYRASGDDAVDGLVVVADSRTQARERIDGLTDGSPTFDIEPVENI
jgi:hypothetical protein